MITLSSNDPGLLRAIAVCLADKQAVFANTLRLTRADFLKEEGHPDQAIALLKSIEPSILRSGFQPHIADLHVSLAQSYAKLGNDADARRAALAAVAASDPGSFTWPLQVAYELLYEIEKRAGNDHLALSYYEKYVVQYKAGMDDAKTRALAYQMVKQNVLSKKMKLDALGKQNRILELRQALASQAQETSHLLIALLVMMLTFIMGAMFWLRRSQLRFRQMARHDGLTGAFNRGHFFDEAGRVARRLHKTGAEVCLVVLDMDHFKRVNDTHGHPAGDEVLRHTVTICRSELRESDVFGLIGGEEFGILMPACSRDQGIEVASRIRRQLIENPLILDEQNTIVVSASFGLACSDISGHQLHQLFGDADAALYRARRVVATSWLRPPTRMRQPLPGQASRLFLPCDNPVPWRDGRAHRTSNPESANRCKFRPPRPAGTALPRSSRSARWSRIDPAGSPGSPHRNSRCRPPADA